MNCLTQDLLKQLLDFDPETGAFTWLGREEKSPQDSVWNQRFSGKKAGSPHAKGFISITVNRVSYLAHRLAWLYVYGYMPAGEIFHLNGDKTDNRLQNLKRFLTKQKPEELTSKKLKSLVHYSPETGMFTWKERPIKSNRDKEWNKLYAGKSAGCLCHNSGYVNIVVRCKRYRAHRLAWLYVYGRWPSTQIDHINGNRADNRLDNLREVINAENSKNSGIRKNNTSGIIGVYWSEKYRKWVASIKHAGKNICLGQYEDKDLAITARKKAEARFGFHPNHGSRQAFQK